jgi:hypothetical protein
MLAASGDGDKHPTIRPNAELQWRGKHREAVDKAALYVILVVSDHTIGKC